MMSVSLRNWPERIGPAGRIAAWIVLPFLALCFFFAMTGFLIGAVDHGHLPKRPVAYLVFAAGLAALALCLLLLRTLAQHRRSQGTQYELRYSRMWMVVMLLGVPAGMLVGVALIGARHPDSVFAGIDRAWLAMAMAVLLTLAFGIAGVLYHRTIDQHEERASLVASTIAYYFLLIAVPVWAALQWGGILPPIDAASAVGLILVSTIVQALAWAWKKYC